MLCFITGCGINCIEGSKGISSTSVNVDVVPIVKMTSTETAGKDGNVQVPNVVKKLQPHWVDTGIRITENQKINLTISGSINMCPKDSFNPKEIIVPAVSCNDSISNVKYQEESIYDDMGKACENANNNNSEIDLKSGKKVESNQIISTNVRAVSTFRLNNGDIFRVNLVPKKVKVTECSTTELKTMGIIYYSDNEIFSDGECKTSVTAENICKNGIQSFFMKMGDEETCIPFTGGAGAINRLQGTEVPVLVDNTYSPHGNKVFYSEDHKKHWIKAPFIYDARTVKNQSNVDKLKKQCDVIKELNEKNLMGHINGNSDDILKYYKSQKEKQAIKLEVIQDTIDVINSFTAYDINCVCGTICKSNESLSKSSIPSMLTINKGDSECSITNDSQQEFKDAKKKI